MKFSERFRWLWVEFVVIILGVLSALFVDTWLKDHEDKQREQTYRALLTKGLQTDVNNLKMRIRYYNSIREQGLKVLKDLDGTVPLDDFTLMFSAFNAAEEWAFTSQASTYLDLQNTGELNLLDDLHFRLELGRYHREIASRSAVWDLPPQYREVARGIIPSDLQSAIHAKCNEITSDIFYEGINQKGPAVAGVTIDQSDCGLNPDNFNVSIAAAKFRSHPDLAIFLRYRVSQLRVSHRLFEGQVEIADSILAQLNANNANLPE